MKVSIAISLLLICVIRHEGVASSLSAPFVRVTALLPELMVDFEVNPDNGDLATVSPVTNLAYLFRRQDILSGGDNHDKPSQAHRQVEVCKTPIAISYKRFNEQGYYSVVCTEETTMYILEAAYFRVIEKASIGGLGSSNVMSSKNKDDPFFYYNYGSGHDSVLAAFDMRELIDRGNALLGYRSSSMDGAVSADGNILYSRGPWSPSGFASFERSTADLWNVTKPEFNLLQ